MFFTHHIWKPGKFIAILVAVISLVANLVILPGRASALGDDYTWTDTTYSSFTASGPDFAKTATFTRSSTGTDGSAVFDATASYTCNGQTFTTPLTVAIAAPDYNGGGDQVALPTQSQLTQPPSVTCVKFDPTPVISPKDTNPVTGQSTNPNAPTCDQGSLTWLMCPVIDSISQVVSGLAITVLTPLLEVKPITQQSTPQLYNTWTHLRDVADVFFILIFFVIIFATLTQQDFGYFDQYTIKKIWPYLIASAILVQFSFLICGFFVDLGNVGGAGVQSLLSLATDPNHGQPSLANAIKTLVTGAVGALGGIGVGFIVLSSWASVVPLLLSLLISVLVVVLTLGLRYLLIAIFIAVSPIAFMLMVLPNTRSWFHEWRKLLLRLVLMYPLIVGVLSLAGIVNEILPFGSDAAGSGVGSAAATIVKPLIVIAAFLVIPLTFKLAGRGVSEVHGLLTSTGQKGRSALKNSDMWSRGREERQSRQVNTMNRFLNAPTMTKLQNGGRGSRALASGLAFGAGTSLLNAPKNNRGVSELQRKLNTNAKKRLDELDEAGIPNLMKLNDAVTHQGTEKSQQQFRELAREAPNLLSMSRTLPGATAITKRLAEFNLLTDDSVQAWRTAPKGKPYEWFRGRYNVQGEFADHLTAGAKQYSSSPAVLARFTKPQTEYEVKDRLGKTVETVSRAIGDVDTNSVTRVFSRMKAGDLGEKLSQENWKVMGKAADPEATADQRRASRDVGLGITLGSDHHEVQVALNPNSRQHVNREYRYEILKAVRAQRDLVMQHNPSLYKATLRHLVTDDVITRDITKDMGVPDSMIESLLPAQRAVLVRDWMAGRDKYDPAVDPSRSWADEAAAWEAANPPEPGSNRN